MKLGLAEPQSKDGLVAVGSRKHYKPCTSFHSMMEKGEVKAMRWQRGERRPQLYRFKVYNSFMRQQVQSLDFWFFSSRKRTRLGPPMRAGEV
ncbi:MAG: hypothetical protein ABIP23_03025 [Pelobium sp.]